MAISVPMPGRARLPPLGAPHPGRSISRKLQRCLDGVEHPYAKGMPTISQVTTITTGYLAGVVPAGSGRSSLVLLQGRMQRRGAGGEPGVPCPNVVGGDGRP